MIFDRQERDHNSHAGRDAAVGCAAVDGAAYEAEKAILKHINNIEQFRLTYYRTMVTNILLQENLIP